MPIRITIPLLVIIAFAAFGFVGGNRKMEGDPNVIRIVSSMPRSGSSRGQTDSIVKGIELALHEVNYELELIDPVSKDKRKYRLEYLDLDDATAAAGQWTIEQEIANANQARIDPDVMVYIGTYNSGAAMVSMPIMNKAKMLMVSPANTNSALTQPGTGERHQPQCYRPTGKLNYIRVCPTDDLQSKLAVQWAKDDYNVKKIYILDDNELYGKGIATDVRKECEKENIVVLGHKSIDTKQLEFKPLLQQIRDTSPDLLYFGGTTQTKAGQILKDMISVGLTCPMMAPDGCHEQAMIESCGIEALKKIKLLTTFTGLPLDSLTEGRGLQFIQSYEKKYGSLPKEAYTTYGYESCSVALDAIRRAGCKDRDAIREAGMRTKDFSGAIGVWSVDANGDTSSKKMSGNIVWIEKNSEGIEVGRFKFAKALEIRKN